jgi:predicted GTPase
MRRMIIMGAGGRDFHDFNVVYRDDPEVDVIAFTATQIPGIADRVYPAALAGPRYPQGIPIRAEQDLVELIGSEQADEVVFAYSDVSHEHVMHTASAVLAAGADFSLLGPRSTMLESRKPVVSVCATRTGAGKSQTSRAVGRILRDRGLSVGQVRHPMPYHDLEEMQVQRFASIEEIDASNPTVEEREEYEAPVEMGIVTWAGVDYEAILRRAEAEADVVIWDGGNNDFPFFAPDLQIVVVDPLRAGDEFRYHPGEMNLRMADVLLVNKIDSASPEQVEDVLAGAKEANPDATVIQARSPVTLEDGPSLEGKAVLVVDDGPTITHGDMPFGAGTVAAREAGAATLVDPRPHAVGSIAATLERFPHIETCLPAMGYSKEQLSDLEATVNATECDAVISGTPIDLGRLIDSRHPIHQATYRLEVDGEPTLEQVLEPVIAQAGSGGG